MSEEEQLKEIEKIQEELIKIRNRPDPKFLIWMLGGMAFTAGIYLAAGVPAALGVLGLFLMVTALIGG